MDARDFANTPVPEVQNGKYLEKIYELQKGLIDGYVKIEGLPPYPVNVNIKKSQILIKDFVGRVIEELAEGYESMLLIDELVQKNRLFFGDYDEDDLTQCINHLQNVSEEMADAMHFMVELLIYINIQPEDISNYISKILGEKYKLFGDERSNIIGMAMYIGEATNRQDNLYNGPYNSIDLLNIAWGDQYNPSIMMYYAASKYDKILYNDFKKCLWDVAQHLNIARNFLKNKPWKQSQMLTDEIHFQEEVVKGFITMMGAFSTIGIDPDTLYHIYFWKNQANHFRQNSKY